MRRVSWYHYSYSFHLVWERVLSNESKCILTCTRININTKRLSLFVAKQKPVAVTHTIIMIETNSRYGMASAVWHSHRITINWKKTTMTTANEWNRNKHSCGWRVCVCVWHRLLCRLVVLRTRLCCDEGRVHFAFMRTYGYVWQLIICSRSHGCG